MYLRHKLVYSTINSQNKVDKSVHHPDTIFLTNSGVHRLILRSNSEDADLFMDWVKEKLLEGVFEKGYYDLREQHQQAIENMGQEHHLVIEEKDTALAMLNDDLDESHRNIAILEQDNLELQRENEILKRRYVPYLEDPKKDNGMVVIQKNNGDEHPYIAISGQQGYVAQKIRNKLIDFPNGQIVVLAETPNSIAHYNWLRERGCIEVNPDRVRHFRLGRNLRHQDLLGNQDA